MNKENTHVCQYIKCVRDFHFWKDGVQVVFHILPANYNENAGPHINWTVK